MTDRLPVTFLEEARALHEDIERYDAAAVRLLREPPRTSREKIYHSHVVAGLLDHISRSGLQLATLYSDETLARRRKELAELSGATMSAGDPAAPAAGAPPGEQSQESAAFDAFYARLNEIQEYHKAVRMRALASAEGASSGSEGASAVLEALESAAYGAEPGPSADELAVDTVRERVKFSGPERFGRCLDLSASFSLYQNVDESLRNTRFVSYLAGLCGLAHSVRNHDGKDDEKVFADDNGKEKDDSAMTVEDEEKAAAKVRVRVRLSQEMAAVLPLLGYAPAPSSLLVQQNRESLKQRDERAKRYVSGLVSYLVDFFRRAQPLFDVEGKCTALRREWTTRFCTIARPLDAPGMAEDDSNPEEDVTEMKDGESEPRKLQCLLCQKEFAKATVMRGHKQSKAHKERAAKYEKFVSEWRSTTWQPVAEDVHVVAGLLGELCDVAQATAEYVSMKQARNVREIEQDAAEGDESDEEDEDDAKIAQIADELGKDEEEEAAARKGIENYPVDFDGKPIPYWMYKLDGLGVEYKCEICGNASFWGRRSFERHFQESQHTRALKLLGIENSLAFYEITKIADAIALAEKLKKQQEKDEWHADSDEEYEDADGNVYSKKMYFALLRQGIIHR